MVSSGSWKRGISARGQRARTELESRQDPLIEENDTAAERDPEAAERDEGQRPVGDFLLTRATRAQRKRMSATYMTYAAAGRPASAGGVFFSRSGLVVGSTGASAAGLDSSPETRTFSSAIVSCCIRRGNGEINERSGRRRRAGD